MHVLAIAGRSFSHMEVIARLSNANRLGQVGARGAVEILISRPRTDIRRPFLLPVILRQSPTIQSSCCADPFLVLFNHPRKSTAPGRGLDGGTRGGSFSESRSDF